ncbi:MAG: mechanosensitive ion channel family protein [Candidatus Peribacteraceae bacterium]|nr:mechanosensitive ion channel family protein [Candidatus Peribacteraceae bacterium]
MNLIPVALAATAEDPVVPTFISNIAVGLATLVGTFLLATFLRSWVQRIIRAKQGEGREEVRVLYGRMVFTITLAIGITVSLIFMGVPLEWFSGGVGLGVAFALRSFIANFFAGVVLLSNQKFNLGDFVVVEPDHTGKSAIVGRIVDIQSRATSIRAIDGGEVTIPNLRMIESAVKCYTKNPIRRQAIEIGVGYGSNLKEACDLIEKTVAAHESVQPEPKVTVLVKEVADSAVILKARFWTESRVKWWIIKSEIMRDVFMALQESKFDVPYQVRTLRVDDASSDILAKDPEMLEKLEQIESAKKTSPKKVFTPTPPNS